jgi:hypothetical protein
MGIAWHQYARSGNGYIVGPGMLAAFVFILVLLLLGTVFVVLRKRRPLGVQLIVFVVTSVAMLWLLSVVWPPPSSPAPVPLSRINGWDFRSV